MSKMAASHNKLLRWPCNTFSKPLLKKSKINDDFEITVTEEGIYGYQCTPHYGMGMVGLILVGDYSANLEQVSTVKHRGRAKKVFDELLDEL